MSARGFTFGPTRGSGNLDLDRVTMGDLGGRWVGTVVCWGGDTLGGETSSKWSLRGVGSGTGVVGGVGRYCWMGVATLGGCWGITLGGCGTGLAWRTVPGVPCACHAPNRSRSFAMALSWVTKVGCGASASAEAIARCVGKTGRGVRQCLLCISIYPIKVV